MEVTRARLKQIDVESQSQHQHIEGVICPTCESGEMAREILRLREPEVTAITCAPGRCNDGGPHRWNGPVVEFHGGGSVSCSKCGALAIDVDLMTGP